LLTAVQWEVYLMMFAECGMEVYETARTVWVEEEGTGRRNIERVNIVSRVRESFFAGTTAALCCIRVDGSA